MSIVMIRSSKESVSIGFGACIGGSGANILIPN